MWEENHTFNFVALLCRYRENLNLAKKAGIYKATMLGMTIGATSAIIYGTAGLCYWYGGELIVTEFASPGVIVQVRNQFSSSLLSRKWYFG